MAAVTLAGAPASLAATDFTGAFQCDDGRPLAGARVELQHYPYPPLPRIAPFIKMITATTADENGRWSFRGIEGERTNVFVRVVLLGEDAQVHQFPLPWALSADTAYTQNNNVPVDYGMQRVPGYQCRVWNAFSEAGREFREQVGGPPPQGATIVRTGAPTRGFPFVPYNTVWWPSGYPVGTTARHEFAHVFRYLLDGSEPHFVADAAGFGYARRHSASSCTPTNDGFAFNEGWAEYWAGEVHGPCPNAADFRIARNVAASLKQFETSCGLSRGQMVQTLAAHRGQIHSLDDFWKRISCPLPEFRIIKEPPRPLDDSNKGLRDLLNQGRKLVAQNKASIVWFDRQVDVAVALTRRPPPCALPCARQIDRRLRPVLLQGQLEQARALRRRFAFLADRATMRRLVRRTSVERQLLGIESRRRAAVAESRRIATRTLARMRRTARRLGAGGEILRMLAGAQAAAARGDSATLAGMAPMAPLRMRVTGPTPPPSPTPTPPPPPPPPPPPADPPAPQPQPPAPAPMPDLVIDGLFLSASESTPSGWMWNIVVRNIGDAGAPESRTGFTESGAQDELLLDTPALAAGESFTHEVACSPEALAQASARADATGIVGESNEGNNGRASPLDAGFEGHCIPPPAPFAQRFAPARIVL